MTPTDEGRRRRYARLKKTHIEGCTKVRPSSLSATERKQAESAQARSGGFIFSSEKPFAAGDLVRLTMRIPGLADFAGPRSTQTDDMISVLGKIVLVELDAEGFFEIGLCLINLDSGKREMLLRHLIATMHSALAPTID